MVPKTDQYELKIRTGLPSDSVQPEYSKRAISGELTRVAGVIKHGECVEIAAGSRDRLARLLKKRGLKAISRGGQDESVITVYAVTPEWLLKHPKVGVVK
jgi:hypothetical protein